MASRIIFTIFALLVFIKICNGRYVIPERPLVDPKHLAGHNPEEEFRDHALRVGNIIADLLRNEIRLMLSVNTTIANGKRHHDHRQHHNRDNDPENHVHADSKSTESHTSEGSRVHHVTGPKSADNHLLSQKDPGHTHSQEQKNKHPEGKTVPEKVKNCACPAVPNGGAQPDTLILEQKFYGGVLSKGPVESYSGNPVIIQRFILNPSSVLQTPPDVNQGRGQGSHQALNHPVVLRPSAKSATVHTEPDTKHSNDVSENKDNNNNQNSNHIVSDPTAASELASDMSKKTSYNPLAGLEETTKDVMEESNTHVRGDHESHDGSDSLTVEPFLMESQVEPPGFELVEATVSEIPPEEVKEEFVHVHSTDED